MPAVFWLKLGPKGPDIHARFRGQAVVYENTLLEADPLISLGLLVFQGPAASTFGFTFVSFLLALFP